MRRPRLLTLLASLVGLAAAAATAGFGWYGIHLLVTVGPPVQPVLWKPYVVALLGSLSACAVMYGCFRLLNRIPGGWPRA